MTFFQIRKSRVGVIKFLTVFYNFRLERMTQSCGEIWDELNLQGTNLFQLPGLEHANFQRNKFYAGKYKK